MNEEEIKAKIIKATEITQNLQEPYKSIAFEIVLKRLIEEGTTALSVYTGSKGTSNAVGNMQASEFLASLNLKSQLDQFEAIVYYFLRTGQEATARTEILDTLSRARLPRPKNISDVIGRCIRRGHLIETDKDGQRALQITPTGERYIEEKLSSK